MALVIKRTIAAGGAEAQVSTPTAIWDVMRAALVEAGWLSYDVVAVSDEVFKSTGETGNETIYFRLKLSPSNAIRFIFYQYWDLASHTGYNELGEYGGGGKSGYGFHDWVDITNAAHDYAFVIDRDSFFFWVKCPSTTRTYMQIGGNLIRAAGCRQTVARTTAPATAGTNVTITLDVDLQAAGYVREDLLHFCAQQTGITNIPSFSARILDFLPGNQVVVNRIAEDIAAGCLVGMDPMPYFMCYTNGSNADIKAANFVRIGISPHQSALNTYTYWNATGERPGTEGTTTSPLTNVDNDPNARTGRYTLERQLVYQANASVSCWRGLLPKVFDFSKAVTLYDIARTSKQLPVKDYLILNPTTGAHWIAVGPVA